MLNRRGILASGAGAVILAAVASAARTFGRPGGPIRSLPGDNVLPSVSALRYGVTELALQRAIDSGAREVVIDGVITVNSDVTLRSGQILRFVDGKIVVAKGARIIDAVLNSRNANNITLVNPVIDARATQGVAGIRLVDVDGAKIQGGRLTRANLRLENYQPISSRISVDDVIIDMAGYKSTAVYLNGVRGVKVTNLECFGGLEGIGIYNNARQLDFYSVKSHGHKQDGFLVNDGHNVTHQKCESWGNGQSGFTTQRQTAGTNTSSVSWSDCRAWANVYDGFDIRGATNSPWNVDTDFILSKCSAWSNSECGFYIVKAEGTALTNCSANNNLRQNLFIDTSDRVVVTGFKSVSGASGVNAGPNKAGILVFNSSDVHVVESNSGNTDADTQDFGVAFTGASRRGRLTGGNLSNNRTGAFFAEAGVLR